MCRGRVVPARTNVQETLTGLGGSGRWGGWVGFSLAVIASSHRSIHPTIGALPNKLELLEVADDGSLALFHGHHHLSAAPSPRFVCLVVMTTLENYVGLVLVFDQTDPNSSTGHHLARISGIT